MIKFISTIVENVRMRKYKRDIETGNIMFTENIYDKYSIHGLDIELDFNVCSYTEKFKNYSTQNLVYQFNRLLSEELDKDVLIALKEEKVKFYLRDSETIQLETQYTTCGFYSPSKKEIHIALRNPIILRKTFFHEVGHFIDNVVNAGHRLVNSDFPYHSDYDYDTRELFEIELQSKNFREYARKNVREFVAVAFESYLNNKQSLNHIPSVKNLLDDYLGALNAIYFDAIISSELHKRSNTGFDLG